MTRLATIGVVLLCVALPARECCAIADDSVFPFLDPTMTREAFAEWLDSALTPDTPIRGVLESLYGQYCEEWASGTAGPRARYDAYRARVEAWESAGRVGTPPPDDYSFGIGFARWDADRVFVERRFDEAVEVVLADRPDVLASWSQFRAAQRRDSLLPIFRISHLPLPDLVRLVETNVGEASDSTRDVLADYKRSLDEVILAIEHQYFRERALRAQALMQEKDVTSARESGSTMSRMLLPVYQITISFAESIIAALEGDEQRAFEDAWIGLWIPELATPLPTDMVINRLTSFLDRSDDTLRSAKLATIREQYLRDLQVLNRRLVALKPPSKQIMWLTGASMDSTEREVAAWYQEIHDEPYAVFPHPEYTLHAERLALVEGTCKAICGLLDDVTPPPDVQGVLSVFSSSHDGGIDQ